MKRLLTGLILIALTLWGIIYLPLTGFVVINTLLMLLAAWEWSRLIGLQQSGTRLLYVWVILVLMGLAWFAPLLPILITNFIFWLIALVWILRYPKCVAQWATGKWIRAAMGILVLIPCWLSLNVIRTSENGVPLILLLLFLIWAADTGAYFSGKCWGRQKLLPQVSPRKTWQGLYGGVVLTLFVAFMGCIVLNIQPLHWPLVLLLALIVALFSVLGDLLESMLKRQVQIKDTGKYLPGHGGLLDRIDSLTAAAPMFLLTCFIFKFLFWMH